MFNDVVEEWKKDQAHKSCPQHSGCSDELFNSSAQNKNRI